MLNMYPTTELQPQVSWHIFETGGNHTAMSLLALRFPEGVLHVCKSYLPFLECWPSLLQTTATTHSLTVSDLLDPVLVPSSWSLQSRWEADIKLIITQILFNYSCYKCFKGESSEAEEQIIKEEGGRDSFLKKCHLYSHLKGRDGGEEGALSRLYCSC